MNNLMKFENDELGVSIKTIKNEDGSISINAEDVAKGFGWYRIETKNDKKYSSIMWNRMNGYIEELGFAHKCAKDDYIPESLFYLLGMKANNEVARAFQEWIAIEIMPAIRKTGGYIPKYKGDTEEDLRNRTIKILEKTIEESKLDLKEANRKIRNLQSKNRLLKVENEENTKKIKELIQDVRYYENIVDDSNLFTATFLAKSFGFRSATQFNEYLADYDIQYRPAEIRCDWYLSADYSECDYVRYVPYTIKYPSGEREQTYTMKWTERGRKFLYDVMCKTGKIKD